MNGTWKRRRGASVPVKSRRRSGTGRFMCYIVTGENINSGLKVFARTHAEAELVARNILGVVKSYEGELFVRLTEII